MGMVVTNADLMEDTKMTKRKRFKSWPLWNDWLMETVAETDWLMEVKRVLF